MAYSLRARAADFAASYPGSRQPNKAMAEAEARIRELVSPENTARMRAELEAMRNADLRFQLRNLKRRAA